MPKLKDLTGQIFERLTVLERDFIADSKRVKWKCQCECGKIVSVSSTHLISGHTKSCGCLQREKARLIMKEQVQPLSVNSKENDLTGKQFGMLTVIKFDSIKNNKKYWKCQCECGKYKIVSGSDLVTHHTVSCGCKKTSQGEQIIAKLLKENNISYVGEKIFPDCIDKSYLRFDFYVNETYIIEFDGIQHFQSGSGWNTQEHLLNTQRKDNIKNNYCKENHIPLIRIPYTILEQLTIDDLLLETTKYRVI